MKILGLLIAFFMFFVIVRIDFGKKAFAFFVSKARLPSCDETIGKVLVRQRAQAKLKLCGHGGVVATLELVDEAMSQCSNLTFRNV